MKPKQTVTIPWQFPALNLPQLPDRANSKI